MNNSITSIQEKAYRDNFLKHGDTLKGVGWNDRETNELIINLINYRQNNPDSIIWKPQRHFYV